MSNPHQSFGKREGATPDEWDAFTGWRRYFSWRAGELRKVKRARHKRERRAWKDRELDL